MSFRVLKEGQKESHQREGFCEPLLAGVAFKKSWALGFSLAVERRNLGYFTASPGAGDGSRALDAILAGPVAVIAHEERQARCCLGATGRARERKPCGCVCFLTRPPNQILRVLLVPL